MCGAGAGYVRQNQSGVMSERGGGGGGMVAAECGTLRLATEVPQSEETYWYVWCRFVCVLVKCTLLLVAVQPYPQLVYRRDFAISRSTEWSFWTYMWFGVGTCTLRGRRPRGISPSPPRSVVYSGEVTCACAPRPAPAHPSLHPKLMQTYAMYLSVRQVPGLE